MCAAPNSIQTQKPIVASSKQSTPTKEPKWLTMKKQNKSSAEKTAKPIAKQSSGSAQKPQQETRNAKRARWAKKARPIAKPIAKRGPVHEYVSACCGLPCTKTACGTKTPVKDPESGKTKDKASGLGKWRCNGVGGCKKYCKVTRKSPAPKATPVITEVPVATA